MTKQEAIEALKNGEKVTHPYFTDGEYMFLPDNKDSETYMFEDGYIMSATLFWRDKYLPAWFKGWEIYKSN